MTTSRWISGLCVRRGVVCATTIVLTSCGPNADRVTGPQTVPLDYSGTWNPATNFGGPFGHDGAPVRSDNFVVFGARASQAARGETSRVAEEALSEVLDFLGITSASFDFLPTYAEPKIHIMAVADASFGNNTGFAYRDGMVVISTESPQYSQFGFEPTRYKRLLKHETTHVVEFLLIGDPQFQQASHVWWREGFAHYTSRPRPSMITTSSQVEDWRDGHAQLSGAGNPLAIHVWSDFPASIRNNGQTGTYYDMFELTVRYVLDPDGFGGTPSQVVTLYDEMGQGTPFGTAMQRAFGLDISLLAGDYWDVMVDYLNQPSPPG